MPGMQDPRLIRLIDDAQAVANIRLGDGRYLGDHEAFVRGMVALGKASGDAGMLDFGDSAGTSRSGRLEEIYAMQTEDPKRYRSKEIQDELFRLEASKQNKEPRK
jgi:hypothetical protein